MATPNGEILVFALAILASAEARGDATSIAVICAMIKE